MLTYGFYNSRNGDRKYDAVQMSSIFDGIIKDGVYMDIGDKFMVTASGSNMNVIVGTGRAWFDHTWNQNDAVVPLTIPQSEVILNRIDAVVLEVNSELSVRANSLKIVKGTPSASPSRPILINTATIHQHPLAYVTVNAGVTSIRQANITNMVGTSTTPFVTGVVQGMNIDALVAKWEDQWDQFYEGQVDEITAENSKWKTQWSNYYSSMTTKMNQDQQKYTSDWNSFYQESTDKITDDISKWTADWNRFYEKQTGEITSTNERWKNQWDAYYHDMVSKMDKNYSSWSKEWTSFYSSYTDRMNTTANSWEQLWNDWFYSFVNENTELIADWKDRTRTDFMTWWNDIKDTLDDMPAGDLASQFEDLKEEMAKWESFKKSVYEDHALYYTIDDTGYRTYLNIQDSGKENIVDSSNDVLLSRTISHDPLIDSKGNVIEGRLLFDFK